MRVMFDDEVFGYLPVAAAQALAPEIDGGMLAEARAVEVDASGRGRALRIRVVVPSDDEGFGW